MCSLFVSTFAIAETLFYKKDGTPVTSQEHEVIYKIMLETQFPTSAAYGNYYDDEIKAMNEKIQKQLPASEIKAMFIPTTLYEMFCLNYLRDNFEHLKQATFELIDIENMPNHPFGHQVVAVTSPELKILAWDTLDIDPKVANSNQNLRKWHGALNSYIFNMFKRYGVSFDFSFDEAIKCTKKIDFWHGIESSLQRYADSFTVIKDKRNILIPRDMERAIAIEYQAYNTQQFVLYRGTDFVDDYHDLRFPQNRSISFGVTLLGGFLFDQGACAYYYMAQYKEKLGYALFINKKEFIHGSLSNMFVIPPLITLLDLCGRREFFHARTKVIDIGDYINGMANISKGFLKSRATYFQIQGDTKQDRVRIYNKILQYIKDNHLIFRKNRARL